MRILYVVSDITRCGGVQRVTSLIASRLSSEYEVCILSTCRTNKEPYFPLDDKVRVEYIFDGRVNFRWHFLKYVLNLRKFSRANPDYHILVNNEMGLVPITYLAFRNHKDLKTVSVEHTNFGACKTISLAWLGKRLACRKSDALVVLTKQDYEDYERGIRHIRRLEQCYNMHDETLIRDSYDPDTGKIMSCGRFVPQKGFDMLVDVAKRVLPQFPDWQWDIYGNGPDYVEVEKKIKEYGLEGQLKLKGFTKNLTERYGEHSLFVLTSRMEGLAVVLMESQANRLPIISFDCKNGPGELILDGENGYLVDCFDIEAMADRMTELLRDREKRLYFSANSQKLFSKMNPEAILASWKRLFETL